MSDRGGTGQRGGAAVRASHLKEDLAALAALGPEPAARVRARISPATLQTIEETTRVDWLPVALNAELADAVFAEGGDRASRAWARASFHLSLKAYFRPLLDTVMALFDPTPVTVFRFAPRAWPAVYRDAGQLSLQSAGAAQLRLVLEDIPPPLRKESFLRAVAGTFEGAFELCRYDGRIELEPGDRAGGRATWLASWSPRAG